MDLYELWISLNRPNPEKFRLAIQRKGMVAPPVRQLRELFYKYQASTALCPAPKVYRKDFQSWH